MMFEIIEDGLNIDQPNISLMSNYASYSFGGGGGATTFTSSFLGLASSFFTYGFASTLTAEVAASTSFTLYLNHIICTQFQVK